MLSYFVTFVRHLLYVHNVNAWLCMEHGSLTLSDSYEKHVYRMHQAIYYLYLYVEACVITLSVSKEACSSLVGSGAFLGGAAGVRLGGPGFVSTSPHCSSSSRDRNPVAAAGGASATVILFPYRVKDKIELEIVCDCVSSSPFSPTVSA